MNTILFYILLLIISSYDHFLGFLRGFLRNMVVRVTGKYVTLIFVIIRKDTVLRELLAWELVIL